MSTITNQYQQERLTSLKGQLKYTKDALSQDLEPWERREFEMMVAEYQKDISELEACLEQQVEIAA